MTIKEYNEFEKLIKQIQFKDKKTFINTKGFSVLGEILFYPKNEQQDDLREKIIKQLKETFSENYTELLEKLKKYHFSSYYTDEKIIDFQINLLKENNHTPKTVLEPSAGTGNYVERLKKAFPNAKIIALEPDIFTYHILVLNNQNNQNVTTLNTTFEDYYLNYKGDKFDLVLSNIPFGNFNINNAYKHNLKNTEEKNINLFFNRYATELTKNSGFTFILTSKSFADGENYIDIKRDVLKKNDLIETLRFNNELFKNEKTKVNTDLILYKKNDEKKGLTNREEDFCKVLINEGFENHKLVINKLVYNNKNSVNGDIKEGVFFQNPTYIVTPNNEKLETFLKKTSNALKKYFLGHSDARNQLSIKKESFSFEFKEEENLKNATTSIEKKERLKLKTVEDSAILNKKTKLFKRAYNFDRYFEKIYYYKENNKEQVFKKDYLAIKSYVIFKNKLILLGLNAKENRINEKEIQKECKELNEDLETIIFQYGKIEDSYLEKILLLDSYYSSIVSLIKENKITEKHFLNLRNETIKQVPKLKQLPALKKSPKEEILDSLETTKTLKELYLEYYNIYGNLDIAYFGKVLNKTPLEILAQGFEEKLFYQNPIFNDNEIAVKFEIELFFKVESGHIQNKIKAFTEQKDLLLYEQEDTTKIVQYYESIKNEKIDGSLIFFNFESPFISINAKEDFFKEIIEEDVSVSIQQFNSGIDLNFSKHHNKTASDKYDVRINNLKYYDYKNILKNFAENKFPIIKDSYINSKGDRIIFVHQEGTIIAQNIYERLQIEFKNFILNDAKHKQNLEDKYYDKFLATKNTKTSSEILTFSKTIKNIPYDHQKAATLYGLMRGTGLFDHKVGHGKTLSMGLLAEKLIKFKKAKTVLIITLKSIAQDLSVKINENFTELKIFTLNAKNFNSKKRNETLKHLKENQYDIIIGEHTYLQQIPKDNEYMESIINEKIQMIEDDLETQMSNSNDLRKSKKLINGLLKRKGNLEDKLNILIENNQRKIAENNVNITFEELMIDAIMIDECHYFKNIGYTTRHQNISGLNASKDTNKTLDLEITIRSIHERIGKDKNIFFYSGTPIKNSVTELYAYQRYLIPSELKQKGINNFDSWASLFLKQSMQTESDTFGNPRIHKRFRYYTNMPEQIKMYHSFTHVSGDETFKTHNVDVDSKFIILDPPTNIEKLKERAKDFAENKNQEALFSYDKYTEKQMTASFIIALNLSRQILVDPLLERHSTLDFTEEDQIKIQTICKDAYKYYKISNEDKGVVLIFSDIGVWNKSKTYDTYNTIKKYLTEVYNIKAGEIAFAQEWKSKGKTDEFQEKIRKGEIRIAIGSTATLGTGLNIQNKVFAILNLDIPYAPDASEQRRGRGERKGNEIASKYNNTIYERDYGFKNSSDIFSISLNKHKKIFINQIKDINTTQRIFDDYIPKTENLSYAQREAALIGDMDTFKLSTLEEDLKSLTAQKKSIILSKNNANKKIEKTKLNNKYILKKTNHFKKINNELFPLLPITKSKQTSRQIEIETIRCYQKLIKKQKEEINNFDFPFKEEKEDDGDTTLKKINNYIINKVDPTESKKDLDYFLFNIYISNIEDCIRVNLKQKHNSYFNRTQYSFTINTYYRGDGNYSKSHEFKGNILYTLNSKTVAISLLKTIKKIGGEIKELEENFNYNLKTIKNNIELSKVEIPKELSEKINIINKSIVGIKRKM